MRNPLLDEKHPLYNRTTHMSGAVNYPLPEADGIATVFFKVPEKGNMEDLKANIEATKANTGDKIVNSWEKWI